MPHAPSVDIIDEMFVVADPLAVRRLVCDPGVWSTWFPGLRLTTHQDRGRQGVRWKVTGDLAGTAEVWLEEFGDGTVVHVYIRAEPTARRRHISRAGRSVERGYALPLKAHLLSVKDEVEQGRSLGEPRIPLGKR